MDHRLIEALMTGIAPVIKDHVSTNVAGGLSALADRIKAIETREPVSGDKGDPGLDGKDGIDGKDGAAGRDGIDGKDGAPGLNGDKGEPGDAGEKGEAGPQGAPGDKGDPGDQGPQGVPGSPGDKGEAGEKGEPGLAGKDGAPGQQGERGEKGMDGPPGRDGLHGKDGSPAEVSVAPDDVADQIVKAISLVAESPRISAKSTSPSPVVLNFTPPPERQQKPVRKTITTSRDKDGNLVAEVVEI